MKRNGRQNKGYAFMRFAEAHQAERFHDAMQGASISGRMSEKPITVQVANTQLTAGDVQTGRRIVRSELGPVIQ
jgi:hypothetical protein